MIYEDNKTITIRVEICGMCPTSVTSKAFGARIVTCGKIMQKTETSCGCIVIGGVLPKTSLKGQSCPQKKW